nr:hypothetical protein [Tanacetum cinerariifolium]
KTQSRRWHSKIKEALMLIWRVTQSSNAYAIDYTKDTDLEKFGFVLTQSLATPHS